MVPPPPLLLPLLLPVLLRLRLRRLTMGVSDVRSIGADIDRFLDMF